MMLLKNVSTSKLSSDKVSHTDGFCRSMSKLLMAQGSARSSTGSSPGANKNEPNQSRPSETTHTLKTWKRRSRCSIPCSITARMPSSEQIMAGRTRDSDMFR